MSAQTAADMAQIGWVKREIDQELALTRQYLDQFNFNSADAEQLRLAQGHLHQVTGAARMLELHGIARFCEEIEAVISALETGALRTEPQTQQLLGRALGSVSQFVDELLQGEPNVPLRLYALYRELALSRGVGPSEVDLFFPALDAVPPRTDARITGPAPVLRSERARYQRGLLGWLRNPSDEDSLRQMAEAVSAVEQAQDRPAEWAFWCACHAFFDGLLHHGLATEILTKQIAGRIDLQMRNLVDGSGTANERLFREVLWQVASSAAVTPRINDVQQAYRLKELLSAAPREASARGTRALSDPILVAMRDTVAAAKRAWSVCATGGVETLPKFIEQMMELGRRAGQLGNKSLAKLITVVGGAASEMQTNPERFDDHVAVEMATALLLIEGALAKIDALSPEFPEQAEAIVARVRHAALGQWNEASVPPLPPLDEMARRAQERLLIAQLAQEVQKNLRQAEEVLDAFFRDPGRRGDLHALELVLGQVDGSFSMLSLDKPQLLLRGCLALIRKFQAAEQPAERSEMELLAEGLSGLGFYMDALRADQPDRETRIVEPILVRLGAYAGPPAPELEAVSAAPAPPVEVDLLEVFVEESREVLESILASADLCRAHPADRDALATIRRGFHTLKGSGRLVGLTQLGDVAWALEQAMNRWIEQDRPATPELLDLIATAHRSFSGWIETIGPSGGHALVEGTDLVQQAGRIEAAAMAPPAEAEVVTRAAVEPPPREEAPAPATTPSVLIGEVAIPSELFAIFSEEARQHLQTLRAEVAYLHRYPDEPTRGEFMRAAHTLAGISRTVGLVDLADLAFSLELLLKASIEGTIRMNETELAALDRAVDVLGQALQTVFDVRHPSEPQRETMVALAEELNRVLAKALESAVEQLPGAPPAHEEAPPALPEEARGEFIFAAPRAPPEPAAPSAPAVPVPVAEAGGERRAIRDDIDKQLIQLFHEEATELLPQVGAELRAWRANPGDPQAPRHLLRSLHTLKGSARMAGAMRLGELTHTMESGVEAAMEQGTPPETLLDDLEERFDRLLNSIDFLQWQGFEPLAPVEAAAKATPLAEPTAVVAPLPLPAPAAAAGRTQALPATEGARRAAQLRVRAELVDRLVNQAGEVSIARARAEAETHELRQALTDLAENVMRLRGQLREIEIQAESQMQSRLGTGRDEDHFDPLEFDRFTRFQELTRMMAESVNDVATVQQNLLKHIGDAEGALHHQARMSRELQQELMRVRAVPFARYAERCYRTVRQAGRDLGKKVRLVITGGETELDRGVLERVSGPIEHVLRNAVAHGIETPRTRTARGKPETGTVSLAVTQEVNEVSLALSDDGAGLDLASIRRRAREMGLLAQDQDIGDAQAMQYIFAPGFSTAPTLSEVSGRGMGMDVVRSEVTSLGGRVELSSAEGQGTTVILRLPLTLAVAQVVLVRAGPRTYAIPSGMVEQVRQVKPEELNAVYETRGIEFRGQTYPFHYLPRLLADNDSVPEARRSSPVALLRSGLQRVAVHVDDLTSNQEVVVKNIGPQLSRVPGIEGATVLGNGQVVLIVNPVLLAQQFELLQASVPPAPRPERPALAAPVVMVVDDSLTVRRVTGRLLAREGYQVMTAKDGLDALQQIEDTVPDLMLVDIEMPRMDGFDLTRHLRSDPRTAKVPIIMITSRTAEKHRSYARDLGVNAYVGKPYQEDELLAQVASFVKREQTTS
jgi:chemosensory pili system protein ChpA (sensor histidine kinase/response regulator)